VLALSVEPLLATGEIAGKGSSVITESDDAAATTAGAGMKGPAADAKSEEEGVDAGGTPAEVGSDAAMGSDAADGECRSGWRERTVTLASRARCA